MYERIMSMISKRMQRKNSKNNWGVWMSVLAAIGIGATAAGISKGRNSRFIKKLQQRKNFSHE